MSATSPLIRISPLQPAELPAHPALQAFDSEATKRPDLLPFVLTLLDQANGILDPFSFNTNFKSHSSRAAPPSNTEVESLTYEIPSSTISTINWQDPSSTAGVGRTKPRESPSEFWVARRSQHANVSSKHNSATAAWPEFVFGLRDNHSRNEAEFTPTIYDARHILDWNADLQSAGQQWKVDQRGVETPGHSSYSDMTLAVYEMCHEIPFPLQPRCFPVLVATASVSETHFIAVTVPVNLSSFDGAFYSTGRNRTEGENSIRKKQVVLGLYTAVEKCELIVRDKDKISGGEDATAEKEETIEWIMATASDAKGNVPMMMQKNAMPSAVAKDVGYFLKWIHTVDNTVIKGEKDQVVTKTDGSETNRRGSRGASSASREMLSSARSSIDKAVSLTPP